MRPDTLARDVAVIQSMTADDLDAVHAVASASFGAPWSRETFAEELERDWALLRVLRPTPREPACAFVNFWIVRDEVHVLNLATHPEHRRRGFARRLLEDTLAYARARHVRYVTLEVRRSNIAAIKLYRALGFASIGVRPKYYAEDGEDALVMLLTLDPETGLTVWRPDEDEL